MHCFMTFWEIFFWGKKSMIFSVNVNWNCMYMRKLFTPFCESGQICELTFTENCLIYSKRAKRRRENFCWWRVGKRAKENQYNVKLNYTRLFEQLCVYIFYFTPLDQQQQHVSRNVYMRSQCRQCVGAFWVEIFFFSFFKIR